MTALAHPIAQLGAGLAELVAPPSGGAGTPPVAGAAVGAVVAPAPPAPVEAADLWAELAVMSA